MKISFLLEAYENQYLSKYWVWKCTPWAPNSSAQKCKNLQIILSMSSFMLEWSLNRSKQENLQKLFVTICTDTFFRENFQKREFRFCKVSGQYLKILLHSFGMKRGLPLFFSKNLESHKKKPGRQIKHWKIYRNQIWNFSLE